MVYPQNLRVQTVVAKHLRCFAFRVNVGLGLTALNFFDGHESVEEII